MVAAIKLTDDELARIAHMKDDRLQYGYRNICATKSTNILAASRAYRFVQIVKGVTYTTPYFGSPEEAILCYVDNPEIYPRVKAIQIKAPENIPPHIDMAEMQHMISTRSVYGFKGVEALAGGSFKGRYVKDKVLYRADEAYSTPIEAAWSVRHAYPKTNVVVPVPFREKVEKTPLPPIDMTIVETYAKPETKYGFANIRYDIPLKKYMCGWLFEGQAYSTAMWPTPQEAVWEFHCNKEEIQERPQRRGGSSKAAVSQIFKEYAMAIKAIT